MDARQSEKKMKLISPSPQRKAYLLSDQFDKLNNNLKTEASPLRKLNLELNIPSPTNF